VKRDTRDTRDTTEGSLVRLQRFITDAVRRSDGPVDAPRAFDAGGLLVAGKRGLSAIDRLEIYREQFWLRHLSNLVDDYPTLGSVLGDVAFRELATGYLTAFPPRTWNLQRLGADLPGYVAATSRWTGDGLAIDASRLDWAFMEAFDAPDAGPLDVGLLASASEDAVASLRLTFHPSLRRLAVDHPVHELREAVKRGEVCERPAPRPARLVVWRDAGFGLRAVAVDALAFELLAELEAGTALGRACEAVAEAHGAGVDLGERVGAWFQQWTASGWLTAIELAP
jgi:hypothetical protein